MMGVGLLLHKWISSHDRDFVFSAIIVHICILSSSERQQKLFSFLPKRKLDIVLVSGSINHK